MLGAGVSGAEDPSKYSGCRYTELGIAATKAGPSLDPMDDAFA